MWGLRKPRFPPNLMMMTKKPINSDLATSPAGYAVIKAEEGLQLVAYRCPAGKWTVGYGHTRTARRGMKITPQVAESLLRADVAEFERDVRSLVTVPLTQGQFDALVSFSFNVGSDIDADTVAEGLGDSALLRKVNAGDFAGAAQEFGKWVFGGGRVLPGLVRRRVKERMLFEGKPNKGTK